MQIISDNYINQMVVLHKRFKELTNNISELEKIAASASNDDLQTMMEIQILNKTKLDNYPTSPLAEPETPIRNQAYLGGCLSVFVDMHPVMPGLEQQQYSQKARMACSSIIQHPLSESRLLRVLQIILEQWKEEKNEIGKAIETLGIQTQKG